MNDLLYKALMLGRNKKVAREEYLVATQQKSPALFKPCQMEITFEDIFKNTYSAINVRLENEGYLEIFASSDAPFIRLSQVVFTSDEAREGYLEIPFEIISDQLHNGKNYAEITLKTANQEFEVSVIADNRIAINLPKTETALLPLKLTRGYLDFRKGFISLEHWQESVFEELLNVSGNSPTDLFFMLYKAHVYIIAGDDTDSENLLEYVSESLASRSDYSPELFAYSLYVRSLYEKNESLTEAALSTVRQQYDKRPSWQLLWLIFYMDETYFESPDDKFEMIQELFGQKKCISPVMYFEAYEALRNKPELLERATLSFGLQLLNFAVKNKIAEVGPVLVFSDILYAAGKEDLSRINLDLALAVLKDAFNKYPVSSLSNTIAKLLVYSDNRQKENHVFFERAVFDYADIPLLYNYYIFTIDEDEMPRIPERILVNFTKDSSYLFESRAYFYANLITNRYENLAYKTAYEACEGQIIYFAQNSAQKGDNSKSLSIIYGHVLQNSGEDIDLKRALFKISFVKEVFCHNPSMARVLVFHKELSSYEEIPLYNARARVSIYSPSSLILFKDETGNIFKNIACDIQSFENEQEYAAACVGAVPISAPMLMGDILGITKTAKEPFDILSFLLVQFGRGEFEKEYEQNLLCGFLTELKKAPVTDKVYDKLMEFLREDIGSKARGLLVELMIENKHYDEAASEIKENGYENINPESLRELTHILVQLDPEQDREFILMLSKACLLKYNEDNEILRYLCKYYDESLKVLLLIYEKSSALNIKNLPVAERILIKSVKENEECEGIYEIFSECYAESQNRDLINYFLEYKANCFLYSARSEDAAFFDYFSDAVLSGVKFSESALLSWLLYMKDSKEISPKLLKALSSTLDELIYKGIMHEDLKEYKNRFDIPEVLANSYIACCIADEGAKPKISYELLSQKGTIQKTVYMDRLFDGFYVKYFTLIFGDNLTYSIEEGKSITVNFSEIKPHNDGSRYWDVNEISRLEFSENDQAFKAALKRYYIKDELIRRLF